MSGDVNGDPSASAEGRCHDVWECRFERAPPDGSRDDAWRLYRHRVDKDYPNAEYTMERNMVALEENVTLSELCAFLEQHTSSSVGGVGGGVKGKSKGNSVGGAGLPAAAVRGATGGSGTQGKDGWQGGTVVSVTSPYV